MTLPVPSAPQIPTPSGDSSTRPDPFELPPPLPPASEIDPDIYAAWKTHMIEGYQHNSEMFHSLLDAFMRPYWATVWMYRLMFWVGLVGFAVAAVLSFWKGWEFGAIFGGLTVASYLAFFVSRPLQALEQNKQFITWLGIIYNTYWNRVMFANQQETVQADLEKITQTTIDQINQLVEKHSEVAGKRVGELGDKG